MAREDFATGFSGVDRTSDPRSFVDYLDTTSALESMQAMKRRTFTLLEVKEGHHLLDVGCGLGADVRALAQLVGPTGRAVGVDSSETMIMEARRRAEGSDLPVEYRVGDARRLDFPDHTFDGCRAERIFVHLDDPRQALAEMVRVARSGGRIVVLDGDWETLVVDAEDRAVTRKLLNFFCDSVRSGWVGRQLPALFHEARLTDIGIIADTFLMTDLSLADQTAELRATVERAQAAGVVSAAEGAAWLGQLEKAGQTGRFFSAVTLFGVVTL